MTGADEPPETVDLAREPDFRLGALEVSPSACRIRGGGAEHRVEPRVMEVLVVLVRHAGQTVTRDQLIEACWDGRIVSDDAVARAVAQVRTLARDIAPAPFTLETVPKVGFRLTRAEPEADPPPGPLPPAGRTAPRRRRTWPLVILGAIGLVAAAAIGWAWLGAPRAPAQNGRVEVMQFDARSPDSGVRQAAADMAQDLIRILSAADIEVTQAPLRRDAAASAAELRVAGSVGLEGGKYVTTSQIIDRDSGVVLWADRVERTPEEQARSPGDFAAEVAAVLACTLKDRKLAKTPLSTEAMGLYLKACAAIFSDDDEGERMLAVARRLVKVAPDFAGAHAMHAIGAALVSTSVTTPANAAAMRAEAQAAADKAIKLDRRAAKAYSALAISEGIWRDGLQHDWFAEERHLLDALKYDPELAPARNEYATLLRMTGRNAEALEFMTISNAADDPRYGGDPRLAMMKAAQGDLGGAEAVLARMESHDRVSQDGMRWTIAFWWDDARVALGKIRALANPDTPQPQACYEAYLQTLIARGAQPLRGLPPSCDDRVDPNWRARMLAREGDIDGAFAALKGRFPGGPIALYYPEMAGVRADPRFWPLVNRIGLVDYWRRSNHWPDFCSDRSLPYDCRKMAAATSGT